MVKKKVAKPIKKVAAKKTTVRKAKKPATSKKIAAKKTSTSKKKVMFTPKGQHSITPYLIMQDAAKAISFYKKVFGAKEVMRMEMAGKINHCELKIGDSKVMLADECPEMSAHSPAAFKGCAVSILLYVKNVDETVKNAVAAGAKLLRPVETMFYGDRSGTISDLDGHQWHISTHVEDVTPAKLKKRATELFAKKKA